MRGVQLFSIITLVLSLVEMKVSHESRLLTKGIHSNIYST